MSIARKFRFEDLEIWKLSVEVGDQLFDIADTLETLKLFRFAEQLRGAGLSISNNIAEGSGSTSNKEFIQFLNYARRSVYECANIVIILHRRRHISEELKTIIFNKPDEVSRKIVNFSKALCPRPSTI